MYVVSHLGPHLYLLARVKHLCYLVRLLEIHYVKMPKIVILIPFCMIITTSDSLKVTNIFFQYIFL